MYSMLLPSAAFHVQRLVRGQPLLCAAILLSLCTSIGAGLALAGLRTASRDMSASLAEMQRTSRPLVAAPPVEVAAARVSLQPFDSAQVVQALNEVSARTQLPLQEVSFALDESVGQPYLRYSATLTVMSKYLTVRRFIDGVHAGLPDAALDSISCVREGIGAQALKCDLVFSFYYMRSERG